MFGFTASESAYNRNSSEKVRYSPVGTICVLVSIFPLIFVAGLRWKVGIDYLSYFSQYADRKKEWLISLQNFEEPGLNIIAKIGSMIYDDPISLIFGASLVTVGLYTWTIKKYSSNFFLSIMLFIFIGTWHGSFNGIRQYLAAAVVFAGHRYIYKRKFWKYLIVVIIAMAFHRTAIIMLPVYFIANRKINMKNIMLVVVAVIAIRFSYDYLFQIMSFFKGKDTSQFAYMNSAVNPLRIAVTFAPLLIAFLGRKSIEYNRESQFYLMFLVINAAFNYGTSGSAYLARAAIYTETYAALAYSKLLVCFTERSKRLFIVIVLIFYFVYWIYGLDAGEVIPYTFYFSGYR